MVRKQLTDLAVRAIKAKDKYFEVVDGTSGLRLAVFPSGAKSWIARYRRPDSGKTAKLTIGKYPAVPLSAARIRVAEARDAVDKGADPGEAKRRAKADAEQAEAERRGDAIEVHIRQHLERQGRKVTRSTWRQARLALEGDALRAWRGRAVSDIRRRDVIALIEKIAETRGPIASNRAFQHVRRFFSALLERDIIAVSPCTGVKRVGAEKARDRTLDDHEIAALHNALTSIGGPVAAAVLMMLYSGQRRSECAGLSRGEIISDGSTWTLPAARSKNRTQHTIPLSDQVKDLIARQPVLPGGDFIFSRDGGKPVSGFAALKAQVDAIVKFEKRFTWHDLRRSVATNLQRLNVPIHVTEAVLNHRSGTISGIAAVYQTFTYADEKRRALQLWADRLDAIVRGEGEPGSKVVKLRRN
jgi:integrase